MLGAAAASQGVTASPARAMSSIVVDAATGRVLLSRNADALRAPASLAKLMTLYLTFDALSHQRLRWSQTVRVSLHAATRSPSKVYLRAGQRVRIRDLIYATAVKSANDAAVTLGEAIAGSELRFAQLMTARARQLGMRHTVFRTASGLPAYGQHTTARDMAILARALITHFPQYYSVFSTKYYRFGGRLLRNTNHLLHRYASVDGMKTGYTRRARFNLVTSAHHGGSRIITVVLGAPTSRQRYRQTAALLQAGWRRAPRTTMVARLKYPPSKNAASHKGGPTVVTGVKRHKRIDLSIASRRAVASTRRPAGRVVIRGRANRETRVASVRRVYGIQVGTFRRYSKARRAVRRAVARLPRRYRRGGAAKVVRVAYAGRRFYRARLIGLDRGHARGACSTLKRRGLPCAVVHYTSRVVAARGRVLRGTPRTAPDRGIYAVQVGAVARYANARRLVVKARRSLPKGVTRVARARILSPSTYSGRLYRVRFEGLSQARARNACSLMHKRGLRCAVIRSAHRRFAAATPKPRQHALARVKRGRYAVQVGAVARIAGARTLVRKARRKLPKQVTRIASARILPPKSYSGRLYRVRFVGLSRDSAKRTCRMLRRESLHCLAFRVSA